MFMITFASLLVAFTVAFQILMPEVSEAINRYIHIFIYVVKCLQWFLCNTQYDAF